MASFGLADLIPKPLTFADNAEGGDGTIYDVKVGSLLSTADIADLVRLEQESASALGKGDAAATDALINRIIAIIIPAMPPERVAAIPLGLKSRILEWWRNAQPEPPPKPQAAGAATNATPAPRSPRRARPTR